MEILRNNSDESVDSENFLITEIKPAVKNQNRVNVFVDSKYSFSLDIAQMVDFGIKVGQRLSEEKIAEYKRAQEFGKLYQRALEWCLSRPHSEKELKDYLYRKRVRQQAASQKAEYSFSGRSSRPSSRGSSLRPSLRSRVPRGERSNCGCPSKEHFRLLDEQVTQLLIQKGYVDDRKFAEYYVENRFVKKGISQKRMRMELTKKGIDKVIIDEVLMNGERNDEEEIKKIIAKKRSKYDDEKLISYLVRQGFDYQLVQNLVHCETD